MENWQPNTWSSKNDAQMVQYHDVDKLQDCINILKNKPTFVTTDEVNLLQKLLVLANKKQAFILQGGDCAETFNRSLSYTKTTVNLLNDLRELINTYTETPIVILGRVAGQFAKPRTNTYDNQNKDLLSYRGDLINEITPTNDSRKPDPNRLISGYNKANEIYSSLKEFPIQTIARLDNLETPNIFTSHEALSLHYEQSLTRQQSNGQWYNLSTHFPWLGVRTNNIDGAHVEYLRGIVNPIGIKISSRTSPLHLIQLLDILNPLNIPGRITLTTRLGYNKISNHLPKLINAVIEAKKIVNWFCDPMHGNTTICANSKKTRLMPDIESELLQSISIHKELGSHLSGIHLELTAENVTECLETSDTELTNSPLVDPRLNTNQCKAIIHSFCKQL